LNYVELLISKITNRALMIVSMSVAFVALMYLLVNYAFPLAFEHAINSLHNFKM